MTPDPAAPEAAPDPAQQWRDKSQRKQALRADYVAVMDPEHKHPYTPWPPHSGHPIGYGRHVNMDRITAYMGAFTAQCPPCIKATTAEVLQGDRRDLALFALAAFIPEANRRYPFHTGCGTPASEAFHAALRADALLGHTVFELATLVCRSPGATTAHVAGLLRDSAHLYARDHK